VTHPAPLVTARRPSLLARSVMGLIRAYQWAFSWTQPRCRFWPSCSQYTLLAVQDHGAWRGFVLGARRISRCHPWNPGGFDPVPPRAATDTPSNIRSIAGDHAGHEG
jgi:putative membrane protein insertion efficiency factor